MTEIRVLIAEDHKTVRTGLRMIIEAEADMKVIGEAGDGLEAIRLTQELNPDVLLLDISMPKLNGLIVASKLKSSAPDVKILTLTRHTDKAYLQELLNTGISGYILKQSESSETLRAIRKVANGDNYIDSSITNNLFNILAGCQIKTRGEIKGEALSDRESEVLKLIAHGFSNKEIADQLNVSVKTIETQKSVALRKLNISGRNEIVSYAIRQGWFFEN